MVSNTITKEVKFCLISGIIVFGWVDPGSSTSVNALQHHNRSEGSNTEVGQFIAACHFN